MSFVLILSFDFQDNVPVASTSATPYISVQAPGASSLPPPVLPSSVPSQAVIGNSGNPNIFYVDESNATSGS